MKRNMDLVREILLALEAQEHGFAEDIELRDYSKEQIGFHTYLMGQAGLLTTIDVTTHADGSPSAKALSITWEGYEFLAATRQEPIYAKLKKLVVNKTGDLSYEILKFAAVEFAKKQIPSP